MTRAIRLAGLSANATTGLITSLGSGSGPPSLRGVADKKSEVESLKNRGNNGPGVPTSGELDTNECSAAQGNWRQSLRICEGLDVPQEGGQERRLIDLNLIGYRTDASQVIRVQT